jgi:MAP3K TRAFs-binding domain
LLRQYRDLSQWDQVIALAEDVPPSLAAISPGAALLALALNRRGHPGDQDRAIELVQQLIGETGGDSDTFDMLGLIYKDKYDQATARGDHWRRPPISNTRCNIIGKVSRRTPKIIIPEPL